MTFNPLNRDIILKIISKLQKDGTYLPFHEGVLMAMKKYQKVECNKNYFLFPIFNNFPEDPDFPDP